MTQIVSSVFENKLRERIDEEIERGVDILTTGRAVTDYAAYRELVGRISALKTLHVLCDDVKDELNKSQ
jgi:hypothetical protein